MDKSSFLLLIEKYLDGKTSEHENQLLLNFYESFQNQVKWDEKALGLKADLEAKMLSRLMSSVQSADVTKRKLIPLWAKIGIAASFLLICGSLYFLNSNIVPSSLDNILSKSKIIDSGQYILPGEYRASLTLANGKKVLLNQDANTILAQQTAHGVRVKDGQLIYNPSASEESNKIQQNLIEVPNGGQFKVVLPDGTKVHLNSASSLYYPTVFSGNERQIVLTGEAYFEVAKQGGKPFKVQILHQNIEVLGTQFNVSGYKNDRDIKTTLIEGSVKVAINHHTPIILKPGQQALTSIVSNAQSKLITKEVDVDEAIAWKNGDFIFANDHILDVMKKIERWYDVEVVYEGKITDDKFYGMIARSKKLADVLYFLETAGNVKFNVQGRRIIVHP